MTASQSHEVDAHSRYLASCGLGTKLRIASQRVFGDDPTGSVPAASSPASSLGARDRRVAEKAEQAIRDICADYKTPLGIVTDIAQDLVEMQYTDPSVAEDPELLDLLRDNPALRCAIVGAAYKLRNPKIEKNAGDLINSAMVILRDAGLENRALKVIRLIEKIFPEAVEAAPSLSR